MVSGDSLPTTLTDACLKALTSDVACDPSVRIFRPGYFYPPETLKSACTSTCKSALDSYWDVVKSSCGNETINGSYDLETSALFIPGMRKDLFQKVCLQDSGRYCNNVAATAAVIADPGACQHVRLHVDDQFMRSDWTAIDYHYHWILYLHAWNPIINAGCYNMHRLNGTQLCISSPGKKFVPGDVTDLPGATVTTPAPVPSDAASGTNPYCGRWYGVKKGDYCNLLVLKFGISMENFIFLNPVLNSNCTNLYAEESYCVLPVGDINTYPGKPGYMTTATEPVPTTVETRFQDRPDATHSPYPRLPRLPIAEGTRDDCNSYFNGADYQFDVTNTYWNSNCQIPPEIYGVDPDSFAAWNAGLGNITSPKCSFKPGLRYCGSYYPEVGNTDTDDQDPTPTTTSPTDTTSTSMTPTRPSPTSPTMTGQPSTCSKWHTVTNGESCDTIPKKYGITRKQFLAWNPSVNSDCTENFWAGYAYCVSVEDTDTTTTSTGTTSTTSSSPPSSTPTKPPADKIQAGAAENCTKWERAVSGDYCAALAQRSNITLKQLAKWNTALGDNGAKCDSMFWINYYYCVAVSN
ncbi:hypothetical protein FQN49_005566 [Arthroderma sp. PD_2]|nr:hypothetical protein FQN49_005566 [Arthroderma sp. PD_2]